MVHLLVVALAAGVVHEGPHLVQEPPRPVDALVAEVAALLERPQEHEVHPERVRAPARDVLVRDHHVPPRLRHLRPVLHDQPVRPELPVGLVEGQVAEVVEHHGDEPRVQQVQHRVLVAADVAVHREPLAGARRVERPVVELGARVAQVVPRRVEERVAHVGLAPAALAAHRAGRVVPLLVPRQRGDAAVVGGEVLDQRELDRQVLLRDRDRAVLVAVDDRDRRAPVALAGDAPVVEPVADDGLAGALRLEPGGDGALRLGDGEAVELGGVDEDAGFVVGERERGFGAFAALRLTLVSPP